MASFMRAHSKLAESGDVSFYSQNTSEVAQRALRESSEDSNGERKNYTLTKALQTNEQQGRVHGVSSGFTKHKSMYRKQKMTLTPQVDVEELLGDQNPILEAQGIQFSDIAGVISEEEHRNNLASTAGGGQLEGELPVAVSPPLHSLLELDMIDNLA
jgi:hypothetical protein